jgi:hypothetical protein
MLLTDGQRLYQIGGTTATNGLGSSQIYSATVNGDGTVGAWKQAGATPKIMSFMGGIIIGSYMYLMGAPWTPPTDALYVAKISSDGQVGRFTAIRLPGVTANLISQLVVVREKIYVVGGGASANGGDKVLVGSISPSIGEGSFKQTSKLPVPNQLGWSFAYAGYLYNVGGTTTGASSDSIKTVYSAKINDDGTLGTWKAVGNLPVALCRMAGVVYKGKIILIGGNTTAGTNVNSFYWAQLSPGGNIGAFNADDLAPLALANSCAVTVGSRLFLATGFTASRLPNVWSIGLSF